MGCVNVSRSRNEELEKVEIEIEKRTGYTRTYRLCWL